MVSSGRIKKHGLVEGSNDRDNMGVVAELRSNAIQDAIGAVDIGCVRLPLGVRHFVTRVIEAGSKVS
jgi:hypothetical protein